MTRRGIFVPFKPDGFDKVIEGAKDKDGHWIAQRVHLIGMPVRTDLVPEADRPKTWSDLKNPKYKGKMVMPDPSFTAIQLTRGRHAVAEARLGLLQGAAHQRHDDRAGPSAGLQDHADRASASIGAEGSDPRSFNDGKDLPNQSVIYPTEGVFEICSPVAIIKNAKNPNAAKLFAQFMLSPVAQKMIADNAIHSSRVDIAAPAGQPSLKEVKFIPIDLDHIEKNAKDLKARFNEIFQ